MTYLNSHPPFLLGWTLHLLSSSHSPCIPSLSPMPRQEGSSQLFPHPCFPHLALLLYMHNPGSTEPGGLVPLIKDCGKKETSSSLPFPIRPSPFQRGLLWQKSISSFLVPHLCYLPSTASLPPMLNLATCCVGNQRTPSTSLNPTYSWILGIFWPVSKSL